MPLIEGGSTENSGKEKALLATVKGDVHDIGKNIVSVVMACNGYRIRDLGVMVECEDIVDTALEWGADVIGLSALITPSLGEMIKVVRELERRGVRIPVVVGGATTSGVHTAVKIAPEYSGPVIHCRDASENVVVLGKLFGPEREEFLADLRRRQEELRRSYAASHGEGNLLSLALARTNRHVKRAEDVELPRSSGIRQLLDYPICDVIPYIDWSYFISSWGLKGRWPEILFSSDKGEEARKLVDDAQTMLYRIGREKLLTLNAVVGIFPAFSRGDDIVVEREGRKVVLPQLRCQSASAAENLSLADYVLPEGEGDDYVCLFAASAGFGLHELVTGLRESGDEYGAILAKLLADRLAEAFAEALHVAVRRDLWGFEAGETMPVQEVLAGNYQGARMAFGYPAVPDHSLKKEVFRLLDADGQLYDRPRRIALRNDTRRPAPEIFRCRQDRCRTACRLCPSSENHSGGGEKAAAEKYRLEEVCSLQPFVGGRMRGVCCSVWRYGLSVSRGADVPDAADFGDSVCGPGRPIGDMDNREKQTVINEALGEFLHVMMWAGACTSTRSSRSRSTEHRRSWPRRSSTRVSNTAVWRGRVSSPVSRGRRRASAASGMRSCCGPIWMRFLLRRRPDSNSLLSIRG